MNGAVTLARFLLKDELPEDHQSRFLAFASGAAAYAVRLLLTR